VKLQGGNMGGNQHHQHPTANNPAHNDETILLTSVLAAILPLVLAQYPGRRINYLVRGEQSLMLRSSIH
jgi:hypothetical protein